MAMRKDSTIYIAGHNGMVGSAIKQKLTIDGYTNVITRSHSELDLCRQQDTENFFAEMQPDYIFLAAALAGGIWANNNFPADFIYKNLMIESNLIHCAHKFQTRSLLFLGSSCIYPKLSAQPIKENQLLTGSLEPTNESYAIAKIAGIKLCESFNRQHNTDFRSVMPCNLYGPNDNFDRETSHVIPALIRKFHEAKHRNETSVSNWGTGAALREFLHVDDLANACIFLMCISKQEFNSFVSPSVSHMNIGSSEEVSIRALAELVSEVVGYKGSMDWDPSKPDGTPRKLMDNRLAREAGWKPSIPLRRGLSETYAWYLDHLKN